MFREMRRKNQLLSEAETIEILQSCTSGVLAVTGDHDYPYAVPLSYAYHDGRIFFHSAITGHKLDGIKRNHRVSFCAIQNDHIVPEEFTTYYRSVIVFGTARVLTEDDEKMAALNHLVEKYVPDATEVECDWDRMCIVEIQIEHMTGKAAKELIKG